MIIKKDLGREHKAKGKLWAKVLEEVDTEEMNGYAFKGEWVTIINPVKDYKEIEDDIEIGKYIVYTSATGSTNHPHTSITIAKVTENGLEDIATFDFNTKIEKKIAVKEIAKIFYNKEEDEELVENLKALLKKYSKEEIIKKLNELA